MDVRQAALLACASFAAGAINSVAGGGTLLSFPAALAAGLPPVVANATNSVALSPAALAAAWAYRRGTSTERRALRLLVPAAAAGSLGGSLLLVRASAAVFETVVPWLVLVAAMLVLAQGRAGGRGRLAGAFRSLGPIGGSVAAVVAQVAIAAYGGYFGAGQGFLVLGLLSLLGSTDVHATNAAKCVVVGVTNAVSSAAFLAAGVVDPAAGALIAAGAIAGGVGGAHVARKAPQRVVRGIVVAVGIGLAGWLAFRRFA